jgi:hypothetical protein
MNERADKLLETWQQRAVRKTGGNKSKLGMVVLAVVGQAPTNLPMISLRRGAVIDPAGWVIADTMLRGQIQYYATVLGSVRDIVESFRGLADVLKLTDAERIEMFDELRKWMGHDMRATSGDWNPGETVQ